MKTSKILALATTLAIFGGVACNKPEAKPAAPTQEEVAKKAADDAAEKAAAEAAAKKAAEEEAARRAAEEAARRKAEEAKKAEADKMAAFKSALEAATKDINFEFDKSDIREADKAKLELLAEFMRKNASLKIRIEGHCDERGTNEYNIALGNRRAAAALAYLKALGVAEDRFETVSFGKEKPKVTGTNEESWFVNRRCEFKML